jgi:RNA polymerase sigma factor (sigma-70 family)
MSAALTLKARDALVAWARRLGSKIAAARGAAYWADEAAHVANAALGDALLAFDGEPANLKPFAAIVVARAVQKALTKEVRRKAWEVSLEDAGAPEPMHAEHACEAVARQVIDDVFAFYVGDELRTNGEAMLLRRELWGALHEEVDRLLPRLRKLAELRYWGRLGWVEVGRALGVGERQAQAIDAKMRERLANALIARQRVRPLGRRS